MASAGEALAAASPGDQPAIVIENLGAITFEYQALEVFACASCSLICDRGFFGPRVSIAERGFGLRQQVGCVVASLLRTLQRPARALVEATGFRLGAPGRLRALGSFALCLGCGTFTVVAGSFARGGWLAGAAPARCPGTDALVCAEADVAKLSVEAAVLDPRAGTLVERRGVQRRRHSLKDRRRQLVPFGGQQPGRSFDELRDRCALALARFAQGTRLAPSGE
jgi:hypothetical protein